MRLRVIAVGQRQPNWVAEGYDEYAKRVRGRCVLELKEVPLVRRTASMPASRAVDLEGERMLAAVSDGSRVVALEERGSPWSTTELAAKLEHWLSLGVPAVCFMIGGPDGLSKRCLERATERWSLSALTLPHGLARIVVAEALYRAWSLTERHPYHRA